MNAYRIKTLFTASVWMTLSIGSSAYAEELADKKARYSTAVGCLRCHQGGEQRDDADNHAAKTTSDDTK